MRRTILSAAFLAAIIAGWLSAKPALATPTLVCSTAPCPVVYVVQNGLTVSNNGPSSCLSTANACALLSDAITQVTAGGTIIIIDDGVYFQSVPITKSVTIVGLMHPSIVPPSGSPAISIATSGVAFELEGVILDGVNGGTGGISATNGAEVRVKDALIKNFTGGGVVAGINIAPGSGASIKLTVEQTQAHDNGFGIVADGRNGGVVRATITDSVVADNSASGIAAISTSTNVAVLVDQTKVTGNGSGLYANGSTAGMVARNTSVFNNTTGLESLNGGKLLTAGNNTVIANTTNGAFTGTAALQ